MKLFSFYYKDKAMTGILNAAETGVIPAEAFGLGGTDTIDFLPALTKEKLDEIKHTMSEKEAIPLCDVDKICAMRHPAQDVICLGINYMDHAVESARFKAEAFGGERPYAVYFSKRVYETVPQNGFIDGHFDIVDSLDYEVELAVIIGKDAKNVTKESAFDYVCGYTILNDMSARNLQTAHKQWYFGKSLDAFTPMGPWIVTKDEFENPPALTIRSYVNGELRQDSTTNLLIFDIPHVIHELSQGMTLKAGTVIAMGTPAGVGMGFVPPQFLKSGDVVACEIQGIGKLVNTIK